VVEWLVSAVQYQAKAEPNNVLGVAPSDAPFSAGGGGGAERVGALLMVGGEECVG
jgi:hypothetical protein